MTTLGFDVSKYLEEQTIAIRERLQQFGGKLYIEFGGKLLHDGHAARVLPGYDPNVKIRLLQQLGEETEIILCIHAGAIERRKVRADFGITYDADAMKLIDDLRNRWAIQVLAVVITRFEEQPAAIQFKNQLERRGVRVYTHRATKGYPIDADTIVSEQGYGANEFIETTRPIVVVTGPGPGSGKLATCLSQVYHEHKRGTKAGYAKFETFPIWNLPLSHPVNIAYESATVDLNDVNMIDPFHLEAYGQPAVNYNRDIEAFPLLRLILSRIMDGKSAYRSPTDMGVNRAGFAICGDEIVRNAAKQEIIRRALLAQCEFAQGLIEQDSLDRAMRLMREHSLRIEDRPVVLPARQAAAENEGQGRGNKGVFAGAAIQLPDGSILTGKNSPLMHAAASAVLNAIKQLAEIPDKIHIISPMVINAISTLKSSVFEDHTANLDLEETLIALSMSATANPAAQIAMECLTSLRGCEMHLTHIPTPGDKLGLQKLRVNLTTDPEFTSKNLYAG